MAGCMLTSQILPGTRQSLACTLLDRLCGSHAFPGTKAISWTSPCGASDTSDCRALSMSAVVLTLLKLYVAAAVGACCLYSHWPSCAAAQVKSCFWCRAPMPLPRRRCWADEVDADVASSDSSTPRPPLAAAPPRRLPFRVILSAYIRGLLQGQGSRASLAVLQGLLRGHPCGQHLRSPLADLVFYISFDDNEIAEHQRDYLAALRAGSFSRAALRFWSSLLHLECRRCLLTCPSECFYILLVPDTLLTALQMPW